MELALWLAMTLRMRTIAWIFCMLLGGWVAGQNPAPSNHRLLWEVKSSPTAPPSYLFGTMHVTDSRVFHLPDSVFLAIQDCPGFALEIDFDKVSYRFLEHLYAQHGEGIFDEDNWRENAGSWDAAPKRDPSEAFRVFSSRGATETEVTFLDAFLYRLARQQGKVTQGLETIEEQMSLLTGDGRPAPADTAEPVRPLPAGDMVELYEQGDLDGIYAIVNSGTTTRFFKEEVIIRRNYGMAERADSLMRIRPTFVGVGAAHLPGPQGVIALLRQRGYSLRPVAATYTGMHQQALDQPSQPQWTTFRREGDGYQMLISTKPFGLDILDGKVKMYLGMDFPHGAVYCFYSMPIDGEIDDARIEQVSRAMVKSFGSHNISPGDTKYIREGGLSGKEYVMKKSGEYLRMRILLGNERLYFLMIGTSKQLIHSELAETWLGSLETFPPVKLSQQTRSLVRDELNGFEATFPGTTDYSRHVQDGFPEGGTETIYSLHEARDHPHRQRTMLLSEDFEDHFSLGRLRDRMPDCILYYASGELEPDGDYLPCLTDGVRGLEGSYQGRSGLRYRMRCYTRQNRLYLLGVTEPDDEPSPMADSAFASLHFLPVAQPSVSTSLTVPGQFSALLPGKPHRFIRTSFTGELSDILDSTEVHFHHDIASSLNASVESGQLWEFTTGTDSALLEIPAAPALDSAHVLADTLLRTGAFVSRYIVSLSHDSTMEDHRRFYIAGDRYMEARIQTLHGPEGHAAAERFFAAFRPELPQDGLPTRDRHASPKLQLLLDRQDSLEDSDEPWAAIANGLNFGYYRLQPSEYDLAIERMLARQDTAEYALDDYLLALLLDTDDPALLPRLQELYPHIPQGSSMRLDIVSRLLDRDWPGAADWAMQRLHDDPSPLDDADFSFSWESYLEQDVDGTRLDRISFLLGDPDQALRLAADMASVNYSMGRDYSGYNQRLRAILAQSVAAYRSDLDSWSWDQYRIETLMQYMARNDVTGWVDQAHQVLRLPGGYLPGSVWTALSSYGLYPTKAETRHALGIQESRGMVVTWILEKQLPQLLPGKFRSQEFVAKVALESAMEEFPVLVELVERKSIEWNDEEQQLFIFRFALPGDGDWYLGFSGPFPGKGLPADGDFPLSGTNWDEFHPNSYAKKVRAWLRNHED